MEFISIAFIIERYNKYLSRGENFCGFLDSAQQT